MDTRIAYFDNAKLILVFLVVFGHSIQFFSNNSQLLNSLDNFIYCFHMPAFIILSGFFFRRVKSTKMQVIRFLGYYFIFEVIFFFKNHEQGAIFIRPYFALWFVVSLICWMCLTKYINLLKHPILLTLAIGILSGYINISPSILSITRTIHFLPYFIFGYNLEEIKFNRLTAKKNRVIAAISMVFILLIIYYRFLNLDIRWLYQIFCYSSFKYPLWLCGIYQLFCYALGFYLSACFFSLVPKRRFRITYWGQNTFSVFLLHPIAIYLVEAILKNVNIKQFSNVIVFLLPVIITPILSTNVVRRAVIDRIDMSRYLSAKLVKSH